MPSAFRDPRAIWGWAASRRLRSRQDRLRSALTWSTVGACAAAVVLAARLPGGKRTFQPGPLARAHALLQDDCRACHADAFQTAHRLAPGNEHRRSVPDVACRLCHTVGPHDEVGPPSACAECHREHRGRERLARVPDQYCLRCHADLHDPTGRLDGDALRITGFPVRHPPVAPRTDPGQLRFNHAAHLRPEGTPSPDRNRVRLDCATCHVPDDAGRYMRPVHYADHCATCHPLSVRAAGSGGDSVVRSALEGFARQPAPHQGPQAVRAALRERLSALLRDVPVLPGPAPSPRFLARRPLPLGAVVWQRAQRPLTDAEQRRYVEDQLAHIERRLYDHAGGCAHCHVEQRPADGTRPPGRLPAYEPTRLPAQWWPHARFRHAAHRTLDCGECHPAAGSQHTSDVLLPGLDTCARCHDRRAVARNDCTECHSYHRPLSAVRSQGRAVGLIPAGTSPAARLGSLTPDS
jgi:hypothetical protein